MDLDTELNLYGQHSLIDLTYVPSDENIIAVGAEWFRCLEVVFQSPCSLNYASGIRDTSRPSVRKCDLDRCKDFAPTPCCHARWHDQTDSNVVYDDEVQSKRLGLKLKYFFVTGWGADHVRTNVPARYVANQAALSLHARLASVYFC